MPGVSRLDHFILFFARFAQHTLCSNLNPPISSQATHPLTKQYVHTHTIHALTHFTQASRRARETVDTGVRLRKLVDTMHTRLSALDDTCTAVEAQVRLATAAVSPHSQRDGGSNNRRHMFSISLISNSLPLP